MSRIEDFRCELVQPDVFREMVAVLPNVAKSCTLSYLRKDRIEVAASAIAGGMQVWVHFMHGSMLSAAQLLSDEAQHIEVKSDSLANAFRNLSDLLNVEDVRMTLSHKQSDHGINSRQISFTMENVGGDFAKTIEQRLYGQVLVPEHVPTEPSVDPPLFADIDASQRAQMARVCEQYKQMNSRVVISLAPSGVLTLKCKDVDVYAETSWRVEFAEKVSQSQSESTQDNDQPNQSNLTGQGVCTARVQAKDWLLVVQNKFCQRMVIGIENHGGVVAYLFLKRLKSSTEEDIATFYLWHLTD